MFPDGKLNWRDAVYLGGIAGVGLVSYINLGSDVDSNTKAIERVEKQYKQEDSEIRAAQAKDRQEILDAIKAGNEVTSRQINQITDRFDRFILREQE